MRGILIHHPVSEQIKTSIPRGGGGLAFSALIPGRNQDEFGIAVAAAHNGNPFIEAQHNQGIRE